VDIYVEPVLPSPRLLVFGISPTARALVRLGKALGYAVEAVDPAADPAGFPDADRLCTGITAAEKDRLRPHAARLFAVVATMGQWDEEATLAALDLEPAYLGVVASRNRFREVREVLRARGASAASLERIRNPAGLDIGAEAPEEVALSILAEVIQVRRAALSASATIAEPAVAEERDPVCGMTVQVASAAHRATFEGRAYYFCCGGCRERFLAAPDRYLAVPP